MIIQKTIDNLWDKAFFKILPKWIRPNHFTYLRILILPFIVYCLAINNLILALTLFIVAVLIDSIDGSLARKRNIVSPIGSWLDPMADKLLVVIFLFFIYKFYPYKNIVIMIMAIEVISIILGTAIFFIWKNYKMVKSDWWGKIKLAFQILGIILILLFMVFGNYYLLIFSVASFGISLALSFISIINHIVKYNREVKRNN